MKITRSLLTSISQFPYRSTPISLSPILPLFSYSDVVEELQKTHPTIEPTSAIYDLSPHFKFELDRKNFSDLFMSMECDPHKSLRAGFRKLLEDNGHITHNSAISFLIRHQESGRANREFGLAMGIFGDMLKRNIPRDHQSFKYLVYLLVKKGQIQDAIQLFEDMRQRSIFPDATIYTSLLKGSCKFTKASIPPRISWSHIDMGNNRGFYLPRFYGPPPSFWEYFSLEEAPRCKLLSAFWKDIWGDDKYEQDAESGLIGLAMSIYGDMLKHNIPLDYRSFNSLTDLLVLRGQLQDAIHLFEEMEEIGMSPNSYDYSRLMQWLFGAGRFEEAFRCYKNLLENNFSPESDLYAIMIKGYTAAGKIDDAFSILREWWSTGTPFYRFDDYFDSESYCFLVLLKHFVDHGLWDRARLLVNRMVRFCEHHPIYPTMVGWLCKAGFVNDAQQIFDDFWFPAVMKWLEVEFFEADMRLSRYNSLLGSLFRDAEFDHAMSLYADMLKRNIHRNCNTFNHVINALVKTGKIQDAIHLFDEMGELVSLDGYKCLIDRLIDRLFEAGHFEEASKLIGRIQNPFM